MGITIEEAIKHCEEVAEELEKKVKPYQCKSINEKLYEVNKKEWDSCFECAKEHRQLAEWLKELKSLKEKGEAKAVQYTGDGYADNAMVYDIALCPNCEYEFEEDSENWECEFCPNCGQRLRWEE